MPISRLEDVTEYPLCWPDTKQRTAERKHIESRQSRQMATHARMLAEITRQLRLWGIYDNDFVISMAPAFRRQTGDPGVALWFKRAVDGSVGKIELHVLACDQYGTQEENLWAIAKTLEALRGIDRWGAYSWEQAQVGMRALPPPRAHGERRWWDVLEVGSNWPLEAIELKYQKLMRAAHPDAGGTNEAMAELNGAIAEARRERTQ